MKQLLFTLCILGTLTSCVEDDNTTLQGNPETLNTALTLPDGWRIIEFIEEGRNENTRFRDYLFVFNSNGTVTASKTGETITGTYLVFRDDGKTELSMNFPQNNVLYELNDDWYFISRNDNTIRFEDSGDTLVFQQQ